MEKKRKGILLKGIAASPGIIIGRAVVLNKEKVNVESYPINADKVDKEIADFKRAIATVKRGLRKLSEDVSKRLGPEYARIFEAQSMIVDDQIINSKVVELIEKEKLNAAYIYYQQIDAVIKQLSKSSDPYLKERILDINSVCAKLISVLQGVKKSTVGYFKGPTVVVARDLTPGDLLGFSVRKKVGFATGLGGVTSHTSLLAKSLNLPAVVGLGSTVEKVNTGDNVIIDGLTGRLYINPGSETLKYYHLRQRFLSDLFRQFLVLRDQPAQTKDGYRIKILNNIELPSETAKVIKYGAEGIGLFRTENLFLTDNDFPDISKQFRIYKTILKRMGDCPVIIRTFDLGGDKFTSSKVKAIDPNPFLGWRAIRFCLDRPDIFKTQLKALLKASVYGNLEIMLPMISNLDELIETKELIQQCQDELAKEKAMFKKKIPLGIMIEIPSAVMIAEYLADEVDFFSLGTNDLIQYALAVDRTNEILSHLYQSFHPAVLKMIEQTIRAGHKHNIRVGICGEFAADPYGVILLVGLGIDEISVNYQATGMVKQLIRNIDKKRARAIARMACRKKTALHVEEFLRKKVKLYFPSLVPLVDFMRGANNG